jgi:multidrug efflux pump subunit AcrA (membrane-fusion protein)
MQRAKVWTIAIALLATGLLLSATMASFGEEDEAEHDDNVQVEDTPDTDAKTLIFTEAAMSHLDVQTAPVKEIEASREGKDVGRRIAVPHSALIYDAEGEPWVYVSSAPDTFLRKHVAIDFMDDDHIFLTTGVTAGENVVTVGVPELRGAEFGVGEGE